MKTANILLTLLKGYKMLGLKQYLFMEEHENRCIKKADWTLIGEVKNNPRMHIPVFGNGDVSSGEKALK